MTDSINPSHYKRLPVEAIEIIESAIDNAPSNQDAFLHGQVLECVLQCWDRNGIEDLKKAKWYLDRLVDSLDKREKQKAADLQSLKDHPFGKLKTAPLNSDTIPEGYRELNDSSKEPRQLGDLRWSVSKKRYVEISGDEIGYANRDNWAACRKITGEATVEVTVEVKPPDGWRWLNRGEVIRKGDKRKKGGEVPSAWVNTPCCNDQFVIRRNLFEIGEKVVRASNGVIYEIVAERPDGTYELKDAIGYKNCLFAIDLAPYEESK